MTTTMTREKVTQLKITICAVVAIFLQSVTLQKKRRKQKRNVKSFLKLTTDWSHWNKIITCLVLIGLRTDLRHRCSHCMEVWAPVQENRIVCTRHKHFSSFRFYISLLSWKAHFMNVSLMNEIAIYWHWAISSWCWCSICFIRVFSFCWYAEKKETQLARCIRKRFFFLYITITDSAKHRHCQHLGPLLKSDF